MDTPCEATVLQRQFLQQLEVHVIPNADGEDADLAPGGLLSVVENLEGVGLPDGGFPIRQEDDEGYTTIFDVIVGHVVVEQPDGPLQGPIDVRACGTSTQGSSSLHSLLPLASHSRLWFICNPSMISRGDTGEEGKKHPYACGMIVGYMA